MVTNGHLGLTHMGRHLLYLVMAAQFLGASQAVGVTKVYKCVNVSPTDYIKNRWCNIITLVLYASGVAWKLWQLNLSMTFNPCMGYLTSPGIDSRWKGPTGFSFSSERHWQSRVNGIAKVPKHLYHDSNPGPIGRQSFGLTTESPHPIIRLITHILMKKIEDILNK